MIQSRLIIRFCSRLNTGPGSAGAIFSQANPSTVHESVFKNNMDDSSFNNWTESLIRTITQPERLALTANMGEISANSEAACKVSFYFFVTVILITINDISSTACNGCKNAR